MRHPKHAKRHSRTTGRTRSVPGRLLTGFAVVSMVTAAGVALEPGVASAFTTFSGYNSALTRAPLDWLAM